MSLKRFLPFGLLALALLLTGCAAASTDGSGVRRDSNLITKEEIEQSGASNLHDAVNRLRPRWLTTRATRTLDLGEGQIFVYQNRTQLGHLDALRQIDARSAHAVRYMDGPTAQGNLPGLTGRHVEGAIVVYTSQEEMDR
jgi:hypothetical protein